MAMFDFCFSDPSDGGSVSDAKVAGARRRSSRVGYCRGNPYVLAEEVSVSVTPPPPTPGAHCVLLTRAPAAKAPANLVDSNVP